MPGFGYAAPTSIEDALGLIDQSESAVLLAGGQSLLVLLRQGLVSPELLVSLKRVRGLDAIAADNGGLRLGAMATYRSVAADESVARQAPLLAAAAGSVGSVHIRNLGTVGGSVCHADPAGDVPTALLALNASVETVKGPSADARSYPIAEFFTGLFETRLEEGEVLREISAPDVPDSATSGYRRFEFRAGEYPMAVAACVLHWEGDVCASARVAVGGGGLHPMRLPELEAELAGSALDRAAAEQVARAGANNLEPIADVRGSADWKRRVLAALLRDTLVDAAAGRN